jgi:hypothetical protein
VGPIFRHPARLSYLFTRQSTTDPGRCRSWRFGSWRRRWRAPWGCWRQCPAAATAKVEDVDGGAPRGCWRQGPVATTTKVEDIDGGAPGGFWRQGPAAATTEVDDVDGEPPRWCWRQGLVAATTEVEDVDSRPPGGAGSKVRQRPPPKLKTSIVGPLGGAAGMSGSGHHRS